MNNRSFWGKFYLKLWWVPAQRGTRSPHVIREVCGKLWQLVRRRHPHKGVTCSELLRGRTQPVIAARSLLDLHHAPQEHMGGMSAQAFVLREAFFTLGDAPSPEPAQAQEVCRKLVASTVNTEREKTHRPRGRSPRSGSHGTDAHTYKVTKISVFKEVPESHMQQQKTKPQKSQSHHATNRK